MKKLIAILLVCLTVLPMCLSLVSCGGTDEADLKVGAILVGDETEGYTLAHMNGINAAAEAITGKKIEVVYRKRVEETEAAAEAARSLIADGCTLIISNSYGHQDYMREVAAEFPNIPFVAMTGDFAAICGISNISNAFTKVFESRYVSGVVAGMKLKELVDAGKVGDSNKNADGTIKLGYVGAFPYAEVVSGYTAFYLGVKSIVENVAMEVVYTESWFSEALEAEAAKYLMSQGCVIISQHADSTGAPSAVQSAHEKGEYTNVYCVGYNVDMLSVAPDVALTSAANNWVVCYTDMFTAVTSGQKFTTNWAKGYTDNAVSITALGKACATGTQAKVDDVIAGLKNGTVKVFNTANFTVGGEAITTAKVDMSYMDFSGDAPKVVYQGETLECLKTEGGITYFDESTLRSAPYFSLRIDGIVESDKKLGE
ncbi:MAG: BMP family ABC transporter substrate-binding protein [Clostridia bacterium]|nr:BMP family ABC transporter substrate-binding protein [Clostridia bacterium]